MSIVVVSNSRAEAGPLESVKAALPEALVIGVDVNGMSPGAAMARAVPAFCDRLRGASLVVLLGDRYETLAAALAATFLRIPIAHIHGGETTTGAFDDAFRDSITRLSRLHFVATAKAYDRVRQLQRSDRDIYLVGAPGLDGIPENSAQRDRKLILVTYHPETMAEDDGLEGCASMLAALSEYSDDKNYDVIFMGVNTDPGGYDIERLIAVHCVRYGGEVRWGISHSEYIALMQSAALVVGNSSAGVIEAPWVGCPSVNIGKRQDGREMADTVFNAVTPERIPDAISLALTMGADVYHAPIYRGGAAPQIAKIVRLFLERKNGR